MNKFEIWYRSVRNAPNADLDDDLKLDGSGEYYYQETFWMHRAFAKGLEIAKVDNSVRICSGIDSMWFAFKTSWSGPKFETELQAIEWAEKNGYHVK